MSTQINQYFGYGYLLPYSALDTLASRMDATAFEDLLDRYYDSAYSDEIAEVDGLSLVRDFSEGTFLFFGKVFAKSRCDRFLATQECPEVSPELADHVQQEAVRLFGPQSKRAAVTVVTLYR